MLQIKMNLVCLEWDYAIKFFTYEKFMQNECWIHKKQSFLISFINLNNIVSNSLSFLTFFMMMKYIKKLWPKAPAKEDALDQISKNFLVYFIPIHFLRNQTKKLTIEPNDATIYICISIRHCLLAQKNGNRKMAQGCRFSPIHYVRLVSET